MSFFYFGVALFIPLQVMIQGDLEFFNISLVFERLTHLNYLIIFLNVFLGLYSFNASSKMIPFLFLSLAFTYLNNYIVGEYAVNFTKTHTLLASLGYTFASLMVLSPSFISLLKDQELRWWRISQRFKTSLSMSIINNDGHKISVPLHDISKTGAFFHIDSLTANVLDLNPGNKITIGLPLFEGICLTFRKAEIIRISESKGHYPHGVGIRFNSAMDFKFNWQLKKFLKEQNKIQQQGTNIA